MTLKVQLFTKRQQQCSHYRTDTGDLVSGDEVVEIFEEGDLQKPASLPGDNPDPTLIFPSIMPYVMSLCI